MNIVTGGLGFIGNELVRQLVRAGEEVAVLDNRNRVAPNIEDLARIPVHEVDITDREATAKAIRNLKPRTVFHLAAIHFIPECNAAPERTLRVNLEGTMGLLRDCAAAGVEHFLYASSGAIYADSPSALSEDSTVGPVDIYGWSKWFAEELCRWQAAASGLKITICRLFNTYGPRETNAHIVPEIMNQLKQGRRLRLGNTKPRRDYIFTADVAKSLRLLAKVPPASCQTVNVARGEDASVDGLIALLSELLGEPITLEVDKSRFRQADKLVQKADNTRLGQMISWRPEVSLRAGLRELLQYRGSPAWTMNFKLADLRAYARAWLRMPLAIRDIESRVERLTFNLGCVQDKLSLSAPFPRGCEYQVFSQAGDDGIIQRLVREVPIRERVFVEFGVQNYVESNTRFLLLKDNWSGLVIDGSPKHIDFIQRDPIYPRHALKAIGAFVKTANINRLLEEHLPTPTLGLLSIDIDGNDYWIWKAIHVVQPAIVITEYNSRFGPSRAVTVPYDENFVRGQAHYAHIYYGASLKALWILAQEKGYDLVCCNSYGNNAFWVRKDLRPASLPALTSEEAFCAGKFREARDREGRLTFLTPEEELKILETLPLTEICEA